MVKSRSTLSRVNAGPALFVYNSFLLTLHFVLLGTRVNCNTLTRPEGLSNGSLEKYFYLFILREDKNSMTPQRKQKKGSPPIENIN